MPEVSCLVAGKAGYNDAANIRVFGPLRPAHQLVRSLCLRLAGVLTIVWLPGSLGPQAAPGARMPYQPPPQQFQQQQHPQYSNAQYDGHSVRILARA